MLIFEGAGGGDAAFTADGLRRNTARGADVWGKAEGLRVDAEEVGAGVGEKRLGVHRTAEVHVEVGALWHAHKKGAELERALAGCGKGAKGAALGSGGGVRAGGTSGLRGRRERAQHKGGEAQEFAKHWDVLDSGFQRG